MSIVVIGPTFVDIKGYPESEFKTYSKNKGRVEYVHGGVSRNIVEDIANLGLNPHFVSLVDESEIAKGVVEHLNEVGVNTDFVGHTPDGMGTWLAIFDSEGDVAAAISKRPDMSPIIDIITDNAEAIFKNCDSVTIEADAARDIVDTVLHFAEKYEKPVYGVISNQGAINDISSYKRYECIVCNQVEMGIVFGEDYSNLKPDTLANVLLDKITKVGIKSMIVTIGSNGAVYAKAGKGCGTYPAFKVDVKDTTGAGDAFFAGASAGLTYGKSMMEACAIGTRLAAAVIQSEGNVCPKYSDDEFSLNK